MDREQDIKDRFRKISELTIEAHVLAKKYVQDRSVPLEVRWTFFVKYSLGHQKPEIYHPECLKDFHTPYGDNALADRYLLSGDRHRTVYFSNVVSNMEADIGRFVIVHKEPVTITSEHIEELKEELLEKYISSFILDW